MCAMAVNGTARCTIQLLGTYDPLGKIIVDDPYYDDDAKAFEKVFLYFCYKVPRAFK